MKSKVILRIIEMLIAVIIIGTIVFIAVILIKNGEKGEENNVELQNTQQANEVEEKYVEVLEDGTKLNTSAKFNQEKTFYGLEVSNIMFTTLQNQTFLEADVTNNTGAATDTTVIDIILLDDEGEEITTITGIIGSLAPGETTKLRSGTTLDFANAYDFKIEIRQ